MQQLLSKHEALVLAELPKMRKLALKLCKNETTADDLVQETIYRALKNHDQFIAGTNIGGWMWTIMRNYFHSQYRRTWRMVEDPDEVMTLNLSCPATQLIRLEAKEALNQIMDLPADVSKILLMFGDGATYEELADELMIPEGTIKSKMSRARALLEGREY